MLALKYILLYFQWLFIYPEWKPVFCIVYQSPVHSCFSLSNNFYYSSPLWFCFSHTELVIPPQCQLFSTLRFCTGSFFYLEFTPPSYFPHLHSFSKMWLCQWSLSWLSFFLHLSLLLFLRNNYHHLIRYWITHYMYMIPCIVRYIYMLFMFSSLLYFHHLE